MATPAAKANIAIDASKPFDIVAFFWPFIPLLFRGARLVPLDSVIIGRTGLAIWKLTTMTLGPHDRRWDEVSLFGGKQHAVRVKREFVSLPVACADTFVVTFPFSFCGATVRRDGPTCPGKIPPKHF